MPRRPAIDITTKQKRILEFIINSLQTRYRCPSVREIGDYVGLRSTATVQNHLDALERFGYIKRDPNKNRSITVTNMEIFIQPEQPSQPALTSNTKEIADEVTVSEPFEFLGATLRQVPLIGQVQAGMPVTAIQNQEMTLPLPVELIGNSECYLLRVRGESMVNAGIYEGDLLIVRHQSTANNGDIVVARIEEEATVKRFYRETKRIRLEPENDNFEPIYTDNCLIEGKVIGLIRDRM